MRVRVHAPEHDVLVVLSEADGPLSLPIVIGPHEGVAIATAQAGMQSPRPGPHDLLLGTLAATGIGLDRVNIVELREGTFIAELVLSNGRRVDSRASDAIAIALRAHVDVWCAEDVLDAAAVVLDEDEQTDVHLSGAGVEEETEGHLSGTVVGEETEGHTEEEVAEFREFLESVAPEDFEDASGDPL